MTPPPLDNSGTVKPHDHPEILEDHQLIRRIDPIHHIVDDENLKCKRISSKALQPSTAENGGMSVDLEFLIRNAGIEPATYVTSARFQGSIAFSVANARNVKLLVGYDPLDENPYHGEVWGNNRPNRFTGSQQKALRDAANWLVEIPGVVIK